MAADAASVVVLDALELPAGAGAVVVDRAAVVVAEELTAAGDVGEDALIGETTVAGPDRRVDRERGELSDLVILQQRSVRVPLLLAAGGGAEIAGAVAEDGDADATRGRKNPGRRCGRCAPCALPRRDGA